MRFGRNSESFVMNGPNHALQRPAIASRLQSNALVGRVAGSFGVDDFDRSICRRCSLRGRGHL